ncbi:MAG: class II fumarate hydratase [Nitrospirae bacterium]|nr:class II fumarate hydratase [Nitrospirota bacterium]
MEGSRIEHDALGEVRLPADALYGAQTQRAIENFRISGLRFPPVFIRSLGMIKKAAARANSDLGLLDQKKAGAIVAASEEVSCGKWDAQFPVDVFQSGSGTSTNMNANEVIANRAIQLTGGKPGSKEIHPNDHVNMCQSTNDVIPTAIHVSAYILTAELLIPALRHLHETLTRRKDELQDIVKTGRTHLMDAVPISFGQEISGWAGQVMLGIKRIGDCLPRLAELAIGGTAVGTGINAHPEFGRRVAGALAEETGHPFREAGNHFAAQAAADTAVELSGHAKTMALALIKICNDLRLMNSGPTAGLSEISLPVVQLGSSIMPGKINPVICESVTMVCEQVTGNDAAISAGCQQGSFEVNIMMPLIAHNLLQSLTILSTAARLLADKAVAGFTVNKRHIAELVSRNPVLVTALSPVIGYDLAVEIGIKASKEGRAISEVAAEMTGISPEELKRLLDPGSMTGKRKG